MDNKTITFTNNINEPTGCGSIEFYGVTAEGVRITCWIEKQALEDFFCKSINEDFDKCFNKNELSIHNLARIFIANNEVNEKGIYYIDSNVCRKHMPID